MFRTLQRTYAAGPLKTALGKSRSEREIQRAQALGVILFDARRLQVLMEAIHGGLIIHDSRDCERSDARRRVEGVRIPGQVGSIAAFVPNTFLNSLCCRTRHRAILYGYAKTLGSSWNGYRYCGGSWGRRSNDRGLSPSSPRRDL